MIKCLFFFFLIESGPPHLHSTSALASGRYKLGIYPLCTSFRVFLSLSLFLPSLSRAKVPGNQLATRREVKGVKAMPDGGQSFWPGHFFRGDVCSWVLTYYYWKVGPTNGEHTNHYLLLPVGLGLAWRLSSTTQTRKVRYRL